MRKLFISIILILLITSGCGFKISNQSDKVNFYISEISSKGEKKINYKLKNILLFQFNNEKEKPISLRLDTKKIKSVKEKNIKNEITKYQIDISVKINVINELNENMREINIIESGHYNITSQHYKTLNNEKKLIDLLTDSLSDKITEELILILNDI